MTAYSNSAGKHDLVVIWASILLGHVFARRSFQETKSMRPLARRTYVREERSAEPFSQSVLDVLRS